MAEWYVAHMDPGGSHDIHIPWYEAEGSDTTGPVLVSSGGNRARVGAALIATAAVIGLFLLSVRDSSPEDQTEPPTIEAEPPTTEAGPPTSEAEQLKELTPDGSTRTVVDPGDFVGFAPDGDAEPVTAPQLDPWVEPERLLVIASAQDLYVIDLDTGIRTAWDAPDVMLNDAPIPVTAPDGAQHVVARGQSGAWARSAGGPADWVFLGPAGHILPSSQGGRVWLRVPNPDTGRGAARYLWTEIDLTGTEHRSLILNRPVPFDTPELVMTLGGSISRFEVRSSGSWHAVADYATNLAFNETDLLARRCTRSLRCEPVWVDLRDGEPREQIYQDLTQNLTDNAWSYLSPDARFAAAESKDSATNVQIYSLVTGDRISNSCLDPTTIEWNADSTLFACLTSSGLEIVVVGSGEPLGIAHNATAHPVFTFLTSRVDGR